MKIIIERNRDGLHVYRESEPHFRAAQCIREETSTRIDVEDCDYDCRMPRGNFHVVVTVPSRSGKRKAGR